MRRDDARVRRAGRRRGGTRIYDVDAGSAGGGRRGNALAPAGSGRVHVILTGELDDTGVLARWITGTFRSEGETESADSRKSFDVYADEPSPTG